MIFKIGGSASGSKKVVKQSIDEVRKTEEQVDEQRASEKTTLAEQEKLTQTESRQTETQTAQTLDPATQNVLRTLIAQIGGEGISLSEDTAAAQPELLDFARFVADTSRGTEDSVLQDVGSILSEARRQGEEAITRQGTIAASQAGSALNSFVQQAIMEGHADLGSQLGALGASLRFQAAELGSVDRTRGMDALSKAFQDASGVDLELQQSQAQQVAGLADVLKGATTQQTGVTEAVGQTSEQAQLSELVAIIESLTRDTFRKEKIEGDSKTTTTKGSASVSGSFGFGYLGAIENGSVRKSASSIAAAAGA